VEHELAQYGGTVGAVVLIVLLLVKELVSSRNAGKEPRCSDTNMDKLMTKELCEERHNNLKITVDTIKTTLESVEAKLDNLPSKINGGLKT
jgi:hypothetical protein